MSIRQDLDAAYVRMPPAGPFQPRPRWRMCPGTHAALTAVMRLPVRPEAYLGIPIEVAMDIKGWELVGA